MTTLKEIIDGQLVIPFPDLKKDVDLVMQIQTRLHRSEFYDFDSDDPDGSWGNRTETGFKQFLRATPLDNLDTDNFSPAFAAALESNSIFNKTETEKNAPLLIQLHRLRNEGFDTKLAQQATANAFPIEFFFAIASRETNCKNMLGDHQKGEFHGVGIIQIDIQHPIALQARNSGTWKTNPDPLIAFGADMLAKNIIQAQHNFPHFTNEQQMKIAASGYNCGMHRAIVGAQHGDSDSHTTGHDYGRDVMTRMAIFAALIAGGN
jgi:hypothetical protein